MKDSYYWCIAKIAIRIEKLLVHDHQLIPMQLHWLVWQLSNPSENLIWPIKTEVATTSGAFSVLPPAVD